MGKQPAHNHRGGADHEVIIMSFLKVVYPLEYLGTAHLSYLDSGLKAFSAYC